MLRASLPGMGRPTVTHHSLLPSRGRARSALIISLLLGGLLGLGACAPEAEKTPVDLLLLIGTSLPGAPGAPEGRALAVTDGRIVAICGPELAERFTGIVTRDFGSIWSPLLTEDYEKGMDGCFSRTR